MPNCGSYDASKHNSVKIVSPNRRIQQAQFAFYKMLAPDSDFAFSPYG